MATLIKLRRGTNAERLTVTFEEGEPVYTTDTKKLYIGDGSTLGGVLAGFDMTSVLVKNSIEKDSGDSNKLQLVNDVDNANVSHANKFYGTDGSGVKGWRTTAGIISVTRSIELSSGSYQLKNDVDTPGSRKYYGTNAAGTRGFYTINVLDGYKYDDETFTYNDDGNIIRVDYGTGNYVTYTYDIITGNIEIEQFYDDTDTLKYQIEYIYNNDGEIESTDYTEY